MQNAIKDIVRRGPKVLFYPLRRIRRRTALADLSHNTTKEPSGTFAINRFGSYFVPDNFANRIVPKVLLKNSVYEPETLDFIRSRCDDGDVITAGAFIGDFLPAISSALAPDARVWTFEANDLCLYACRKTISINGLSNVSLIDKALGSQPDRMIMRVFDFTKNEAAAAQSAIDPNRREVSEGYVEVDVVTLDSVVPQDRKISILHLDIEGYELEALKGSVTTIERCKPIIILELNKTAASLLNDLTSKFRYIYGGSMERNSFFFPVPNDQRDP